MPKPIERVKYSPKKPPFEEAEEQARKALTQLFGIPLRKEKLDT